MQIALFGGSFDPPHPGHLLVADTLLARKLVDDVWFLPCADHPFHKQLSPVSQRLAMLQLLSDHTICTYEAQKATASYSVETLEFFQALFPADTFSWVVGADQLATFTKWHRYQDILTKFHVHVYPRDGFPTEPLLVNMSLLSDVAVSPASSTQIRQLLAQGQAIDGLSSPAIISYIKSHQLYTP